MSSLRQIKNRIQSVTTTRQMTASMKIVAVSRLKRTYAELLKTIPFAEEMNRVVRRLIRSLRLRQENLVWQNRDKQLNMPPLINGNGKDKRYILVVITSDDGLSGAASLQLVQQTVKVVDYLLSQQKTVHVFTYGVRGSDVLKRTYPDLPVIVIKQKKDRVLKGYAHAERIASDIIESFNRDRFDVCLVIYNQFRSVISQIPVVEQIIPNQLFLPNNPWDFLSLRPDTYSESDPTGRRRMVVKDSVFLQAIGGADMLPSLQGAIFKADLNRGKRSPDVYDYEPSDTGILQQILPRYLTAYMHRIILESEVSDNAARLMAMDNATRNAGDMLADLNRTYRRTRQSKITTDIAEVSTGSIQENPI